MLWKCVIVSLMFCHANSQSKNRPQGCSTNTIDLAFLVDGSGSICNDCNNCKTCDNYEEIKSFVTGIINTLLSTQRDARVALVLFGYKVHTIFDFNGFDNAADMVAEVQQMHYLSSRTNTQEGLKYLRTDIFNTKNGDRTNASNVAILLTDGVPNEQPFNTLPSAKALQDEDNVQIFAVGITKQTDVDMLKKISSLPQLENKNWWQMPDFQSLDQIISDITEKVCHVTLPPTTPTTTLAPVTSDTVFGVFPQYGPLAGGTLLTINGTGFDMSRPSTLYIGNYSTAINESDITTNQIKVLTQPANKSDLDVELPLWLHYADGWNQSTPFAFSYRSNPEIYSIYPLKHFISGGTNIYTKGENLDTVQDPLMIITQIYTYLNTSLSIPVFSTQIDIYEMHCLVENGTIMQCMMPKMKIPNEFLRHLNNQEDTVGDEDDEYDDTRELPLQVGNSTLEFEIVFKFDGVKTSETLSGFGKDNDVQLVLFAPPIFDNYNDPILFYYEEETFITLKGDNLNSGATQQDYTVTTGDHECVVEHLGTNFLSCAPPKTPVNLSSGVLHGCITGTFSIMVTVGHHRSSTGCLQYVTRNDVCYWCIGLGCGLFTLFLLIILNVVMLCFCKNSSQKHSNAKINGKGKDTGDDGSTGFSV